jgi:hypothetical protein
LYLAGLIPYKSSIFFRPERSFVRIITPLPLGMCSPRIHFAVGIKTHGVLFTAGDSDNILKLNLLKLSLRKVSSILTWRKAELGMKIYASHKQLATIRHDAGMLFVA